MKNSIFVIRPYRWNGHPDAPKKLYVQVREAKSGSASPCR